MYPGGAAYLELVLAGLSSRAGVEKINGENLEESIRQRQSMMHPSSVRPVPSRPAEPEFAVVAFVA